MFGARKVNRHESIRYWLRCTLYGVVGFVTMALIELGSGYEFFLRRFVSPVDFQVREILQQKVVMDPRLKVVVVDDSTVSYLNRANLELNEWAELLEKIASTKPHSILVDKIFASADTRKGEAQDQKSLMKRLSAIDSKIIVGAFTTPEEIRYRQALDVHGSIYEWSHYSTQSESQFFSGTTQQIAYGPFSELQKVISGTGHIQYAGNAHILPFIPLRGKKILPHIGLLSAGGSDSVKLEDNVLSVNDKQIALSRDHSITVNLLSRDALKAAMIPARLFLNAQTNVRARNKISAGDTVIILPNMFTGNTDFQETPLGSWPVSYVHVSLINSVLTGQWLRPLGSTLWWILVGSLLGAFLGGMIEHYILFWGLSAVTVLIFVGAQIAFSFAGFLVPWFATGASIYLTGGLILLYKSRIHAKKTIMLRTALDGAINPSDLKALLGGSIDFAFEAREQVVTIMFIDVVGYSLLAENQIPRVAFDHLKYLLSQISGEIHRYGGMVNKTLGDGLMCIFGYNFDGGQTQSDHAEKAISCAISIQKLNVAQNLDAARRGEPVYPLRIGVHTASVFLGDLGSGERFDFTAVGHGVNFAKRLEEGCEMHSVLMSGTTRDLSASLGLPQAALKKRSVAIKHYAHPVDAFEFDPIHFDSGARAEALEAYRRCASLARTDQRFVLHRADQVIVKSTMGSARIINYSTTGLSVKLRSHLVKGSQLRLRINTKSGEMARELASLGIQEIHCEVRWSYTESDGSVHGLQYLNLSEDHASQIVELLRAVDSASGVSSSGRRLVS